MTQIFSDAAGYTYLGDCLYANHNLDYPTDNFLLSVSNDEVMGLLDSYFTNAGIQYRSIISQSLYNTRFADTAGQSFMMWTWAPSSDVINDRFSINFTNTQTYNSNESASSSSGRCTLVMFNNNGCGVANGGDNTTTGNTNNNGLINLFPVATNFSRTWWWYFREASIEFSQPQWTMASDGEYLAVNLYQRRWTTQRSRNFFMYQGIVDDVNTGFNYYSANNISKSIMLISRSARGNSSTLGFNSELTTDIDALWGGTIGGGAHYVAGNPRLLLTEGKAQYTFVCSDGQTPQATWLSDFYVFDNNPDIGSPAIGKVRGLLLGTGDFTYGKPVKITGSVVPDSGSRWYLPVGLYAGKTILMKCYSSGNS